MTTGLGSRVSLRRAGLLIGPATLIANLVAYALSIALARLLTEAEFGAATALLAVVLVGSVPGAALQQVSARRVASVADPPTHARIARDLLWAGLAGGLLVAIVTVAATPLLTRFLHLPSAAAVHWLALALFALTAVNAMQGVLQGTEHFSALAAVFLVGAVARFGGTAGGAVLRPDVVGAIAGLALSTVVATVIAVLLALPEELGAAPEPRRDLWRRVKEVLTETARAVGGLTGFLLLANLDVVLARHYLPRADSGAYGVGSLITKAALFGPGFVTTIVYARLTSPGHRRRALRLALALLVAVGAAGVVVMLVAAGPVLSFAVGSSYAADLANLAWLFALFGALLVIAQLVLFARIAVTSTGFGWVVVAAAAAELSVVAVVAHGSLAAIVGTAAACAAVVVAVGAAMSLRE